MLSGVKQCMSTQKEIFSHLNSQMFVFVTMWYWLVTHIACDLLSQYILLWGEGQGFLLTCTGNTKFHDLWSFFAILFKGSKDQAKKKSNKTFSTLTLGLNTLPCFTFLRKILKCEIYFKICLRKYIVLFKSLNKIC